MEAEPDPFDVLGTERHASAGDLFAARQRLSAVYAPDRFSDDPTPVRDEAARHLARVERAYEHAISIKTGSSWGTKVGLPGHQAPAAECILCAHGQQLDARYAHHRPGNDPATAFERALADSLTCEELAEVRAFFNGAQDHLSEPGRGEFTGRSFLSGLENIYYVHLSAAAARNGEAPERTRDRYVHIPMPPLPPDTENKRRVVVHTQAELDAAVRADPIQEIVVENASGRLKAVGQIYVIANGPVSMVAKARACVVARAGAKVWAKDALVTAEAGSYVDAKKGSSVTAKRDSRVDAESGATVFAHAGSFVRALVGSQVSAYPDSEVRAKSGSTVTAYPGAAVSASRGATIFWAGAESVADLYERGILLAD